MDDSKISQQKKNAQSLEGEKVEELLAVKHLEDEIRKLNHKLSSVEEENKILLEQQELAKVEKIQITQEYENLKSDFSMLQSSVAEQDALLKEQEKKLQSKASLPEDVVRLQEALLGTKIMIFFFSVYLHRFSLLMLRIYFKDLELEYENVYLLKVAPLEKSCPLK